MSIAELTALIIAITGVAGLVLAHRLGVLGQKNDAKQQAAATKLQERIAAFDELESLNDRLREEINRLRDLLNESETRGDARLSAQARRCRDQLEKSVAALAVLQAVVLGELARVAAQDARQHALEHLEHDHPHE